MSSICPICNSETDQQKFLVKEMYYGIDETFEYVDCGNCGLIYQSNPPENLGPYYPENYHCHHIKPKSFHPKTWILNIRDKAIVQGKENSIAHFIDKRRPTPQILKTFANTKPTLNARILDIGCGSADFLFQLEDIGFKYLTGIDPFLPDALNQIPSSIHFYKKSIFETEEKFDIITLNHVFEHMSEPDLVFEKLDKILKPNGTIMIRIPVSDGIAWQTFRENWYQLDAPRHLFLHSSKSINILAKRNGFEIVKTVFDSTITQFTRSALYEKGITSIDFLNKYEGKLENFFSEEQLDIWKKETEKSNQTSTGDQAAFILKRTK